MPDETPFIEKFETGDSVPKDQTFTLRVHYAKKKFHGKLLEKCPICLGYYEKEAESEHKLHCRPRLMFSKKKKWKKGALRRAFREADKKGKLAEFIAQL